MTIAQQIKAVMRKVQLPSEAELAETYLVNRLKFYSK